MKLRASLLATGVVPLARAAAGLHSTSEPPRAGRRKHREHLREAPAVYTQLSCKLRAQDNFGDHCLLNSPLPGLQAIHPSHAAGMGTGKKKMLRLLICFANVPFFIFPKKPTIGFVVEIAWVFRGREESRT